MNLVKSDSAVNNKTRRPRSGAQSGSRIYQLGGGGGLVEFDAESKFAIKKKKILRKIFEVFEQKLERFCFGLWVPSGSPIRSIGEPQ